MVGHRRENKEAHTKLLQRFLSADSQTKAMCSQKKKMGAKKEVRAKVDGKMPGDREHRKVRGKGV